MKCRWLFSHMIHCFWECVAECPRSKPGQTSYAEAYKIFKFFGHSSVIDKKHTWASGDNRVFNWFIEQVKLKRVQAGNCLFCPSVLFHWSSLPILGWSPWLSPWLSQSFSGRGASDFQYLESLVQAKVKHTLLTLFHALFSWLTLIIKFHNREKYPTFSLIYGI